MTQLPDSSIDGYVDGYPVPGPVGALNFDELFGPIINGAESRRRNGMEPTIEAPSPAAAIDAAMTEIRRRIASYDAFRRWQPALSPQMINDLTKRIQELQSLGAFLTSARFVTSRIN